MHFLYQVITPHKGYVLWEGYSYDQAVRRATSNPGPVVLLCVNRWTAYIEPGDSWPLASPRDVYLYPDAA